MLLDRASLGSGALEADSAGLVDSAQVIRAKTFHVRPAGKPSPALELVPVFIREEWNVGGCHPSVEIRAHIERLREQLLLYLTLHCLSPTVVPLAFVLVGVLRPPSR